MVLYRYLVYRLLGEGRATAGPEPPPVSCSPASVDSVCRLFNDDAHRRSVFLSFLRRGIRGVFFHEGSSWWTYAWTSRPSTAGPGHLPRWAGRLDAYWIFYCRTRQAHRGRGFYGAAMGRLIARARREDPQAEIYIDTTVGNRPSRRAILKAGFQPRGVALVLDIPGLRPRGIWLKGRPHPA